MNDKIESFEMVKIRLGKILLNTPQNYLDDSYLVCAPNLFQERSKRYHTQKSKSHSSGYPETVARTCLFCQI